ncbi:MAG: hypothetical protein MI976_18775 [Pseudomonadales bacterium]|nr:hypothetical protein [Pseudomonadales bacterium]
MKKSYTLLLIVLNGIFCSNSLALISTDSLQFKTEEQPLFDQQQVDNHPFTLHILDEHIPETTVGQIRQTPDQLPVSTLQTIWRRALAQCESYTYSLIVAGVTLFRRSPSEDECIAGEIRQAYCVAPPKLGWSGCVNVGGNRKTYVKDIGSGIGEEPTQPTTRSYDIGMELHYSMDVEMGVEGHFIINPGTVDVAVGGKADLTVTPSYANPGDSVQIETTYRENTADYKLVSKFPNIDFSLGTFIYARADVATQYASVDYDTGEQLRGSEIIYRADSRDSTLGNKTVDGIVRFADTEWLGLNFSPAGVDIRLKETTLPLFNGGLYRTDLVIPGIRPVVGVPGFSFADLAVLTPELDSPAAFGLDCGECVPLREQVDTDGIIYNTVPAGTRTLIGGVTDGYEWTLPPVNDGIQDTDFFRLDFDMDVISLVWGVPLGAQWQGPKIHNKAGLLGPVAAVELNALDIDLASFWSVDQTLSFNPKLQVTLRFTPDVEVYDPLLDEYVLRAEVTVTAGETVDIIQPSSGVEIEPIYHLAKNEFINNTRLQLTLAIQETLLQMRAYGIIPSLLGSSLGFNPNFAALQLTPELADPIKIFDTGDSPVTLEGFKDVRGNRILIGTKAEDSKIIENNSQSNGSQNNGSTAEDRNQDGGSSDSGSSGGGSLGAWFLLAMALGLVRRYNRCHC